MWSAVRVAAGDGQAFWLTEAKSDGARSVVGDFKSAAIFWRREQARVAIEQFLRSNGHAAHQVTIVHLDRDFYSKQS